MFEGMKAADKVKGTLSVAHLYKSKKLFFPLSDTLDRSWKALNGQASHSQLNSYVCLFFSPPCILSSFF